MNAPTTSKLTIEQDSSPRRDEDVAAAVDHLRHEFDALSNRENFQNLLHAQQRDDNPGAVLTEKQLREAAEVDALIQFAKKNKELSKARLHEHLTKLASGSAGLLANIVGLIKGVFSFLKNIFRREDREGRIEGESRRDMKLPTLTDGEPNKRTVEDRVRVGNGLEMVSEPLSINAANDPVDPANLDTLKYGADNAADVQESFAFLNNDGVSMQKGWELEQDTVSLTEDEHALAVAESAAHDAVNGFAAAITENFSSPDFKQLLDDFKRGEKEPEEMANYLAGIGMADLNERVDSAREKLERAIEDKIKDDIPDPDVRLAAVREAVSALPEMEEDHSIISDSHVLGKIHNFLHENNDDVMTFVATRQIATSLIGINDKGQVDLFSYRPKGDEPIEIPDLPAQAKFPESGFKEGSKSTMINPYDRDRRPEPPAPIVNQPRRNSPGPALDLGPSNEDDEGEGFNLFGDDAPAVVQMKQIELDKYFASLRGNDNGKDDNEKKSDYARPAA